MDDRDSVESVSVREDPPMIKDSPSIVKSPSPIEPDVEPTEGPSMPISGSLSSLPEDHFESKSARESPADQPTDLKDQESIQDIPGNSLTQKDSDSSDTPMSPAIDPASISNRNANIGIDPIKEDTKESSTKSEPIEDINEDLTPPPESIADTIPSRASSVSLNDEIVVGADANNNTKASPTRATPESKDIEMGNTEDQPLAYHPKRKRSSVSADSDDEHEHSPASTEDHDSRRFIRPTKPAPLKGVVIGFWRDSPVPNDADKHSVIGFIDARDRLRTRIQPTTRDNRTIDHRYPIPPGPGGSWVTFDKIAFDEHLVGHNHHVVKEYVKLRAQTLQVKETPEQKAKRDKEAIDQAVYNITTNPPPEGAIAPLIAYGPDVPDNAVLYQRGDPNKRRRVDSGTFGGSEPSTPTSVANIPGTRPTRVLVGYWKHSSEPDPANKHAVFGILGANDMFRVKLARETRDGRPCHGNFPTGAGALWIHWDEVEFEPHLKQLTRAEIKEYCRVRQQQIDRGEAPEDRIANETKAVYQAQQRVASNLCYTPLASVAEAGFASDRSPPSVANGNGVAPASNSTPAAANPDESRRATRAATAAAAQQNGSTTRPNGRTPLPDIEFRAANRTNPMVEKTNNLATRAIARMETAQARQEMRIAAREAQQREREAAATATANGNNSTTSSISSGSSTAVASTSSSANRAMFQDHISRLNRVWASQEANRARAGNDPDTKVYMGIKYERKQSGPFQGKLVSSGTIISIDGEDYVEYRVLMKPSFC